MQVTEKTAEGLSREFRVVIPQSHLSTRLDEKLEEVKGSVHLKGFRPGKAPISFLKKMYGKGMMSELIQEEMATAQQKALDDAKVQPAMPPHPHLDDGLIQKVIEGDADLEYDIHVEVLPDFEPADVEGLALTRMTADIPDAEVDEEVEKIAKENTQYEDRDPKAAAEDKDQLTIDFVGKIDGE
ncbi:MAG: trigger factor, partial [Pseudomonadota bacterium]